MTIIQQPEFLFRRRKQLEREVRFWKNWTVFFSGMVVGAAIEFVACWYWWT